VVAFVDYDVFPALCAEALEQASAVEALDGREEMIESSRIATAGQELAERLVAQDMPECVARLP
jgi:hypothetical protein